MANRVTDSEVKTILDTDITTTPFINTANLFINENTTLLELSDDRLYQIELYLSAHFACTLDPRITQEKIGDATNTYQLKSGLGLDATMYGQTAKMLDTTGTLANLTKDKVLLECL
jgi:hypothetical protein